MDESNRNKPLPPMGAPIRPLGYESDQCVKEARPKANFDWPACQPEPGGAQADGARRERTLDELLTRRILEAASEVERLTVLRRNIPAAILNEEPGNLSRILDAIKWLR